jgi:hypothetical protein
MQVCSSERRAVKVGASAVAALHSMLTMSSVDFSVRTPHGTRVTTQAIQCSYFSRWPLFCGPVFFVGGCVDSSNAPLHSSSTKLLASLPKKGTSTLSRVSACLQAPTAKYAISSTSKTNSIQLTILVQLKMMCSRNSAPNTNELCHA